MKNNTKITGAAGEQSVSDTRTLRMEELVKIYIDGRSSIM